MAINDVQEMLASDLDADQTQVYIMTYCDLQITVQKLRRRIAMP